jgi:hypothetical protein
LPSSLTDWLPEGHLARFVSDLVDEALDLSAFYASYAEARGVTRISGISSDSITEFPQF